MKNYRTKFGILLSQHTPTLHWAKDSAMECESWIVNCYEYDEWENEYILVPMFDFFILLSPVQV